MVYVSRIEKCLSMLSAAVLSKAGDLVVWVEVLADVAIPKPCPLDQWVSAEDLLLLLDLAASVVVSVVDSEARHVVVGLGEVSEVIDLTFVEVGEVSDIKEAVALVGEVGMVVVRLMATVMAPRHPLMHLLVLEEEVALVVGTVALL